MSKDLIKEEIDRYEKHLKNLNELMELYKDEEHPKFLDEDKKSTLHWINVLKEKLNENRG